MKKLALPFVVTTALAPALLECNKDPAQAPAPADAKVPPKPERVYRNPPKPSHAPADAPGSDAKPDPADQDSAGSPPPPKAQK